MKIGDFYIGNLIGTKAYIGENLIWEKIPYILSNNEILYKTSSKSIINNLLTSGWSDSELVILNDNTYENGWGRLTFSGDVTKVPDAWYDAYPKPTKIRLPNSVTKLEGFTNCSDLQLDISQYVSMISNGAVNQLSAVTLSEDNPYYKLQNSLIITADGESVISSAGAISGAIVIPQGVKRIEPRAIHGYNATDISLPDGLTYIGYFGYLKSSTFIIPESVTEIDKHVLWYGKIGSLYIPGQLVNLSGVFDRCSVENIEVSSQNSQYDSRDNCNAIIETTSNTLIKGSKNTTIPSDVVKIGDYAFADSKSPRFIEIGDNVTDIGIQAFYQSSTICVSLPASITSIGSEAFKNVYNLNYEGTLSGAPWGASNQNLPTDKFGVYQNQDKTILKKGFVPYPHLNIPLSVQKIDTNAYFGCTEIKGLVLFNGVTEIGATAFDSCAELQYVNIGSGVNKIGARAFRACYKLNEINYAGTSQQWYNILKGSGWNYDVPATVVHCLDGDVTL